ncbi:hypothetical protein QBC39DRAFT_339548 [Podospora conica]|nr:hypothetical protein QBC39DRAFT_339548 [Schizothecium conicum]
MASTERQASPMRKAQQLHQEHAHRSASELGFPDDITDGELAPVAADETETDESDQDESEGVDEDPPDFSSSGGSEEGAIDLGDMNSEAWDEIVHNEQLAGVGEVESDVGVDSELHIYDIRQGPNGERVTLRTGTRTDISAPYDRSSRACLVLRRFYRPGADRGLDCVELCIQSPHLKRALQVVIGSYPGVTLQTSGYIIIQEPPMCLFHYRRELEAYAKESPLPIMKSHLKLLLGYMEKTLEREIRHYEETFEKGRAVASLEHQHLWMAYKPGELLFAREDGVEFITRMVGIQKVLEDSGRGVVPSNQIARWKIDMERVEFHGKDMEGVQYYSKIPRYDGCRQIASFQHTPLQLHPEQERIKRDLTARGRRYQQLGGVFHKSYNGPADFIDADGSSSVDLTHSNVSHRVIIDAGEFRRNIEFYDNSILQTALEKGSRLSVDSEAADGGLSEEQLMMCHYEVPGFSLQWKRWGYFRVDCIHEVDYNDQAFSKLVFSESKKKQIRLLVEQHESQRGSFHDIEGKGRGVIFLLHGPPGVGKTFTAESIADYTRRPLLTISSGQVIGPAQEVEARLSKLLSLAKKWNSVVLLDEADVFMQERAIQDLERNALVSIFLRTLEYFEGTMFLTTNRVETLDRAFHSRIHMSISYPRLTPAALSELWTSGITRACGGETPGWLSGELLKRLSDSGINGREVKNIISMAYALADREKRAMESADIFCGLETLQDFEAEFNTDKRKIGRKAWRFRDMLLPARKMLAPLRGVRPRTG